MDSISFRRSTFCPQLYILDCTGLQAAGGSANRIAFLLPRADPAPEAFLSSAAAWNQAIQGCYIFLAEALAEAQQVAFAEAAWNYLADRTRANARLAWFANPNAPEKGLSGQYLALYRDNDQWLTDRATLFDFMGVLLMVGKNCIVTPASDENGFHIEASSGGRCALISRTARLEKIKTGLDLALCGSQAGSLQFTLELGSTGNQSDLAHLDVGLRIFYPYQPDGLVWSQPGEAFIASQRFPIFSEEALDWQRYNAVLALQACLDPLAPLDGNRTYFSLLTTGNAPPAAALPSYYRTNLGYTVYLTPRPNSRLVFAPKPESISGQGEMRAYLVPAGDFEMSVPRYTASNTLPAADNLLCGVAGVEYIRLASDAANVLCFIPGQPAYAANFIPGQPITNTSTQAALKSLGTTAWAYIYQESAQRPGSVYYAQPDQAVLYRPAAAATGSQDILLYMEVPAANLPVPTTIDGAAFPLLPYAGAQSSPLFQVQSSDYRALELHLISPLRRQQITQISMPVLAPTAPASAAVDQTLPSTSGQAPSSTSVTGTTPQGLLATFSADFATIELLTLARDAAPGFLGFTGIERTSPLRDALQSNQLFLVISNPASLQPYFRDHLLDIAGWTFDLDPAGWQKHGTLMIFKFFEKSLTELVEAPNTWSHAADFNQDADTTRKTLSSIFQTALTKANDPNSLKNQENYAYFASLLDDPHWSGILVLNAPLPGAGDLPPQLEALSAGLDPAQFYAHHIGIRSTPVKNQAGTLVADLSSLFGLIDYVNSEVPPPTATGFNFQVSSLKVLFANSQVKSFSSEITVTLDKLFNESILLQNSTTGRNILTLIGSAEDHAGTTTYAFSFNGDNRCSLPDSGVLNEVEILKAQFSSDPPKGSTITGRFSFWGRLNFHKLESLDVFSFGANPPDAPSPAVQNAASDQFLSFAGLQVTMQFDPGQSMDPNGSNPNPQFHFDYSGIFFDTARSKARADSLYAHFPLKLSGFLASTGDKKPDQLGYLPVKSPLSSGKITTQTWYGLTFDLELGSVGALAGKAGIVVSLLAAWSPSGELTTGNKNSGAAVGLRLPSLTGDKLEMMILGVVKIAFQSIELVVSKYQGQTSYLLKLKNIALKLLTLSLPPNTATEIIIFGDPQGSAGSNTLGWYAAYARVGAGSNPNTTKSSSGTSM
jgi:hypothetical protein